MIDEGQRWSAPNSHQRAGVSEVIEACLPFAASVVCGAGRGVRLSGPGKNVAMDSELVDRLRTQISESEEVLAEEKWSADPVARRRVSEALRVKAQALGRLGRHRESVEAWDELVSLRAQEAESEPLSFAAALLSRGAAEQASGRSWAALQTLDQVLQVRSEQSEITSRWLILEGWALSLKRDILSALGRVDEALGLDKSIVTRFCDSTEPALRRRVAYALGHRAHTLLRTGRSNEALHDGEELIRRLEMEGDPTTVVLLAQILVTHARLLLSVGNPGFRSVMLSVAVALGGAVGESVGVIDQRLHLTRAPGLGRLVRALAPAATWAFSGTMPDAFAEKRCRAAQALAVNRALEARLDKNQPDHQQFLASAAILSVGALILLGRLPEGLAQSERLINSGQEAVAAAFARQAPTGQDGFLGELGTLASLAQRARTLGQGDNRIAHIAFEESTRPGAPGAPASLRAKLLARLLGP